MSHVPTGEACPLCETEKHMGSKARRLYGERVCRRCFWSFALRRHHAYVLNQLILGAVALIPLWLLSLVVRGPAFYYLIGLAVLMIVSLSLLWDGFEGGSPGKAIRGLRVVDATTGQPATFSASLRRNLPLFIPLVGLLVSDQIKKGEGRRIGDVWANTKVIWEKYRDRKPFKVP